MNTAPHHRIRTLVLVTALHAFTHVYQVALLPLYFLVRDDFKLSGVDQATFLLTAMMICYTLPSYPMGVLADRLSRKKLLGWGLFINAIGITGLALAPNYPVALLCVFVAGVGGSFFHPAATALVARLFPTGTGRALGILGMGASVGFFVGPIYAGWRAKISGDWRTPILELGILGFVMTALFAWLAEEDAGLPTGQFTAVKEKMFPAPALLGIFLTAAFAFSLRDFAGSSMASLGSLFLQQAHGLSIKETGAILSGIFLASVLSNPLFGHLSDRGRIRWTCFVLMAAAVLVAIFPHVPKGWHFAAFTVYGFFFMASYPMVEAGLMQSVPDAVRGRVFGLFITIGGLIGNLSHWIMGRWVRTLGDKASAPESYYSTYAMLACLIVLSLIGLACLHALRQREHLGVIEPILVNSQSAVRHPRSE